MTSDALNFQTVERQGMTLDLVQVGYELWFCALSVARTLEYDDSVAMLAPMKPDETRKLKRRALLSEGGLYRAVLGSSAAIAEPYRRWVVGEVVPRLRRTGQYGLHDEAQRLGVRFDFTETQWDWLKARPDFVDILPLAAAGYNSVEITRLLNLHTSTGITARKRIERLKQLGFLPKKIEPHIKQLVCRIEKEQAAKSAT